MVVLILFQEAAAYKAPSFSEESLYAQLENYAALSLCRDNIQ